MPCLSVDSADNFVVCANLSALRRVAKCGFGWLGGFDFFRNLKMHPIEGPAFELKLIYKELAIIVGQHGQLGIPSNTEFPKP